MLIDLPYHLGSCEPPAEMLHACNVQNRAGIAFAFSMTSLV